jgi:ABC-type protease/lipase transport system fused ATPase/permease subunit
MLDGDATEIGDRGVTLSGGQKARVGFARMLYAAMSPECRLAIIDDPLAAVDVEVTCRACRLC